MRIAWLQSKVGPQILKISPVSTCFLKNLGHKLSDEVLGSPLASKLSDRRPLEIFLGEALKKCKNWHFLLLLLLLENFVKKNFIRIGPCERARTQLSEYVWHMGVRMIIGQVITAQSQDMAAKVSSSPKLWGVEKKRHGHNFQNFGSTSNQRGTIWVSSTLIRFGA